MSDWLNPKKLDQARGNLKQQAADAESALKQRYLDWRSLCEQYDQPFRAILSDTGKYLVTSGGFAIREARSIDVSPPVYWGQFGTGERIKFTHYEGYIREGQYWWEHFDKYRYVHHWLLSSSNIMREKKGDRYVKVFLDISLWHIPEDQLRSQRNPHSLYSNENMIGISESSPGLSIDSFFEMSSDLSAAKSHIQEMIVSGKLQKVALKQGLFSSKWVEKNALGYESELVGGFSFFI